ncbi:unnamed protein product [Rotaria sp. Silwood2]|nr:unnamed protein product [Rotaria sp. Silwood2]CAF3041778.1 unnamed protein product [Rotaria sp. Silwood2]CAF4076353.1 unnamed protein product [Rotaria sp. Silwood2]CAF4381391.1 unnamed protein product [Rotaria sp. Silwood2]
MLRTRFTQTNFKLLCAVENFILNISNKPPDGSNDCIKTIMDFCHDDIDIERLKSKAVMISDFFKVVINTNQIKIKLITKISTVCEILNTCEIGKQMLQEFDKLIRLYLTIPVTTATSERAFSVLNRLKNTLRSSMTQSRLNHCLLAHIYKEKLDKIDPNQIMSTFISSNEQRQAFFGLIAKWTQNGVTIAGGQGAGNALNQLNKPHGVYVDDDQTVYIANTNNHRIVAWKPGATSGQVVAGGNRQGNRSNQLNQPTNVMIDREADSFIICDCGNVRVMLWLRRRQRGGETIIKNIACWGLTLDDHRFLYVCDCEKHEVRRYRIGETDGIVVAGGNELNQLKSPMRVFVDLDYSVYVSSDLNHRVMKWVHGAKEGIIVAGGREAGANPTQLSDSIGLFVDPLSTIYVAEFNNHRVTRWRNGAIKGNVIVGGNGPGQQSNQLNHPLGLTFNQNGDLYVTDKDNYRVQLFSVETIHPTDAESISNKTSNIDNKNVETEFQ